MSGNDDAYLRAGQILVGKYRIERVLGGGGMGVVALATHVQLDQRVALKFLKPEHVARPELLQRFAQEARAAARIRGEHVARVTDVETLPDGAPFMVMEYLEGEDLSERMQRTGRLPYLEAAGYILEACEAIAEAHALRVVHRDLKPANLFLARQPDGGQIIKVLDFGISKMLDDEVGLTKTQASFGSIPYMAPEQMRNAKYCDERTDIWALGVTLYELVTQSYPFHGSTGPEVVAAVMEGSLISLASIDPHAPQGVVRVIHRCMQRDPSQRYIDVAELAGDLAALVATPEAVTSAKRIARVLGVDAGQLNVGSLDVQRMHGSNSVLPGAPVPGPGPVPVPLAFAQGAAHPGQAGQSSQSGQSGPYQGFAGAPGAQPIPGPHGGSPFVPQGPTYPEQAPHSQRMQGPPASVAPASFQARGDQAPPPSGAHGGRLSQTSPEALAMASTTPPAPRGRFLMIGLLGGGLAVASLVVLLLVARSKGHSSSSASSPPPESTQVQVTAATASTPALAPSAAPSSAIPTPEASVVAAPNNEAPKDAVPTATAKSGAGTPGKKAGASGPAASPASPAPTGQVAKVEPKPAPEPPATPAPATAAPAPKSTRPNPNNMTFK
jgi:serine/threonine-protein kinase